MNNTTNRIAEEFYAAFKNKDADGMKKLYHTELQFVDPAFGKLDYQQASAMWSMLCESAKDLVIDFSIISSDDKAVKIKWIAEYSFSKTNRFVHNEIIASMTIEDGLIIEHIDSFNLHKWARQALGLQGLILGGTKFFRNKLQTQTNRQLSKYINLSST